MKTCGDITHPILEYHKPRQIPTHLPSCRWLQPACYASNRQHGPACQAKSLGDCSLFITFTTCVFIYIYICTISLHLHIHIHIYMFFNVYMYTKNICILYIGEAMECLTLQAIWAQNPLARAGASMAGKDGWQKFLPTCSAKQFGQHVFQAFHALLP